MACVDGGGRNARPQPTTISGNLPAKARNYLLLSIRGNANRSLLRKAGTSFIILVCSALYASSCWHHFALQAGRRGSNPSSRIRTLVKSQVLGSTFGSRTLDDGMGFDGRVTKPRQERPMKD